EVNEDLQNSPELINEEPYDGGWIVKVKMSDPDELKDLKDAEEYLASIEED
ncbi:TPA: glycine cleavage system protein H, partial [Vibrio cholerae]